MDRRESLLLMASASLAAGFPASAQIAIASDIRQSSERAFFTEHEYATINVLADLVLPADERSGSATDAGVPEFIDFIVAEQSELQLPIRGGLAWLDYWSIRRYGNPFTELAAEKQTEILDDIAWPDDAQPEVSQGVAFFNRFRNLTAAGFWSSKMGVEDLQYKGNVFVQEWTGCPDEVLKRLGVDY